MDLELTGKQAICCASSRGLGKACALSLAKEGVDVVINATKEETLLATADEIAAATGVEVTPIVADINTQEGREKLLAACDKPDILVNNNWGPPPGKFEDFEYQDWLQALEANMLAPLMMIKGVITGMRARKFGRIINVTSAMVKSPFTVMALSAAARTGLTSACKALSRDVAVDNVTINNLLPERIDTDRQIYMAEQRAKSSGMTFDEARTEIVQSIAAKRMGKPQEFGDACAYLCSVQASYISGQNLQLDGGSYRGVF